MALWTIGHSTRTRDELIGLLATHGITRLVDVRTVPRSRRNPQFDRETLPGALERAGVAYTHAAGLGGLRRPRPDSLNLGWKNPGFRGYADYMQTPEFEHHLHDLLLLAAESSVAVMCAEAVPWRCHRSLIADAATARGITVRHILSEKQASVHRMTPFARIADARVTYPGLTRT